MLNYTWHIMLVALAGWMNRQQQEVIEYLKEENRVLREKLGPRRVLLDVCQKRRLATAAFKVGRKLLQDCATFFSPDTLLKWHRTLVLASTTVPASVDQRLGRPTKCGPRSRK